MKQAHILLAGVAMAACAPALLAQEAADPAPEAGKDPAATPAEPAKVQAPLPPDEGEPIISDSQFEEALPPIDPELDRPLEPIGEIEAPAPGTAPTMTDSQAAEPPADPELDAPLAPIAGFDVEPPPATGAPDESERVEPLRYTLAVEGLADIGLEGRFRDLSALEDADGEATNGAMVAARAEEDELLAVRLLRSEGYYDASASSAIEQLPDDPAALRVVVTVVAGNRYAFGPILVTGPPTDPAGLAREALNLTSGAPIVAAAVEGAEANVRLKLPQEGYPFAEIGLRDILLDPETRLGEYSLPVTPGPRVRFRGVTSEGDVVFGPGHIETLSRFDRGDLYDSRRVDDLREAMVATNLFATVAAEPVRTGEIAPDGAEFVDILVRQDEGPARALAASAGFSTGEGLRVEFSWEHRNLFPPEGALRVAAVAGTQEQSLGLSFRRSNAGKRDRSILLLAEAGRRDFAAFQGYTARIQGLVSRESTPIWQKRWTWGFGAELIATNEDEDGFPPISLGDAFFLAGISAQLGYDRSNSLLDPTKGFRLLGRINPEASIRDPGQPYIRNFLEGSVYVPASKQLVVAARARVGSIAGASLGELAPSRRLYAGGGGSVRGFGFQELGPRNINDRPTGGRSLVEFAIEGRYRFGNFGVVPFIDAGNVYDSQYPTLSGIRFGAGVGGRVYTNFGPLRFDIATPIGRRKGEGLVNIYISIGQAF